MPAEVVVDLTAAEAAAGTAKTVAVPPDGTPVMIYFPPGARDGMVQNVELPWVDPATGATSRRTVAVAIRVVAPAGAVPPYGTPPPAPGYLGAGYAAPQQRRFSQRAKVVAVALGIVLVGGICLVPTLFRGSNADTTKNAAGDVTTTTTTPATEVTTTAAAAPPLDPAAFQSSLDAADKELAAALGNLRKASTPRAVSGAADAFAQAVQTQASALSGVTAPAAATAAHSDLVSALSALESELTSVSSSADSRSVCTGGSASAALSRADAAADLRSAITALAAADPAAKYRFGSFLPAVTKDQNRRKANGTYLSRTTGGSGELKIDNGNNVDTVINLVKSGSKKPSVSVYIRGNKKVTTGRIKDGTYQVFMSSGTDWDGKRFSRDCQFSKFDSPLKFTTTSRQYTIWELSLKVRLGGNASSSEVDPDSFPS
ncbi:hypothetical protein [Actinoplanes philippinensis]|nr:hypothetical protein [Actinoplanes philippinensis]